MKESITDEENGVNKHTEIGNWNTFSASLETF